MALGLGGRRRAAGRWAFAAAFAALACGAPAVAGPPYVTDDPEPTETGHWEVYGFVSGAHKPDGTEGDGGLDINYGAARDLQLTLMLPMAYERGVGSRVGFGDIEVAAKSLILHQDEKGWRPDIAIFPAISIPTATHHMGSGHVDVSLPVWAQKDFGPWQVFGGGEYTFHHGPGARDYWSEGLAVQRRLGERLAIGAEVYHHGADAIDAKPFTGLNLGVSLKLNPHWSVLAAGGPGLENPDEGGRYAFYLALKADY